MHGKLSIYMRKIAYSTKFSLVFTQATTLKLIVLKRPKTTNKTCNRGVQSTEVT
jgi:hypothetical protein